MNSVSKWYYLYIRKTIFGKTQRVPRLFWGSTTRCYTACKRCRLPVGAVYWVMSAITPRSRGTWRSGPSYPCQDGRWRRPGPRVRISSVPRPLPIGQRVLRANPQAVCRAAERRRASCRTAQRPIAVVGCGKLAAAAAESPWLPQGHQDHHRGPAPRDIVELVEADPLSAERLLLNKKFSLKQKRLYKFLKHSNNNCLISLKHLVLLI